MAEFVTCPVKADTIGNSTYLRWVQFCERTCPFCKDTETCRHKTENISFPLNSKEVKADKAAEVEEAWANWSNF